MYIEHILSTVAYNSGAYPDILKRLGSETRVRWGNGVFPMTCPNSNELIVHKKGRSPDPLPPEFAIVIAHIHFICTLVEISHIVIKLHQLILTFH